MSRYYKDEHRYDDIMDMPHYQPAERAHMSLHDRAAQFAPFAALTGHEDAINETARLTEEMIVLDDTTIEKINKKLYEISMQLPQKRNVSITYFKQDTLKKGGAYLTDVGSVKKIDDGEKLVIMESGMRISMEEIIEIEYV